MFSDLRFDAVELGAQSGLELLQLLERERVSKVSLQELVLLDGDLLATVDQVADGLACARGELIELVHEHSS
ncbi:hypothetical protein ACFSYH_01285 [Populibacterium corticicola]|uniref:Uncharacterized protein n=1 Tax=Populibacterium corticicola TaxID=1812826 RepID=A0ABW5XBJ1_9MICO